MRNQTSLSAKANQGRVCGVLPFIIVSTIAARASFSLIWITAAIILPCKKETV